MTATRTIAIVSALPEELAPLRDRLRNARPLTAGASIYWWGQLCGVDVVLAVTGDGQRLAQMGVAAVLRRFSCRGLIAVGAAGALHPDLQRGDVVFAQQVIGLAGEGVRPPEPVLQAARQATGFWSQVQPGVVVTRESIVDSAAAKQRLAATLIAGSETLAQDKRGQPSVVDLESIYYANAAANQGVPWAILRAVSDTASQTVPALLNRCRDEGGAIQRLRVFGSMLREPGTVPALLRLRGAVRLCGQRLAAAVQELVAAWPLTVPVNLTMGGSVLPGERDGGDRPTDGEPS